MTHSPEPFTFTLPNAWTPEQAQTVHAFLADLLEQIEAHYGRAVQQWLAARIPMRRRTVRSSVTSSRRTSTTRCPSD